MGTRSGQTRKDEVTERLAALRAEIDDVDERLVAALAERFAVVREVALLKADSGLPVLAPDRLRAVLERARAVATRHGLDPAVAHRLYDAIHAEACALEEAIMADRGSDTGARHADGPPGTTPLS